MNILAVIFGIQNHIDFTQESARAVLIFTYCFILLRFSGRRTFGHWSALDIVVSIMLGSALARAMTGSAPLPGTMAAAAIIVALHVGLSHLAARSRCLSCILEGEAVMVVDHRRIDHPTRKKHMISENDLEAALRQDGVDGNDGLINVKAVTLETSGEISVIKLEPFKSNLN